MKCQRKQLNGLYSATNYQNFLIKELIQKFKYEPFIKELAKPLASLVIDHFKLLDKEPDFSNFSLMAIPLWPKRLKWRGFNQSAEISKELSKKLNIPLISDCLIKTKETIAQVKLSKEERERNIKGAFFCKNKAEILNKKILLLDDIYTTGATMEEAASILLQSGAKGIWGITVARE